MPCVAATLYPSGAERQGASLVQRRPPAPSRAACLRVSAVADFVGRSPASERASEALLLHRQQLHTSSLNASVILSDTGALCSENAMCAVLLPARALAHPACRRRQCPGAAAAAFGNQTRARPASFLQRRASRW